jgi:hypothetical protein
MRYCGTIARATYPAHTPSKIHRRFEQYYENPNYLREHRPKCLKQNKKYLSVTVYKVQQPIVICLGVRRGDQKFDVSRPP